MRVARFERVNVIDDILGRTDTIGRWVGTDRQTTIAKSPGVYSYALYLNENRDLLARLKLFANSDAPEYMVLVARLRA